MGEMDISRILRFLPHRYPFLLIDRVLALSPKESLTAVKNVTYNEQFFQGHFPERPIMPAVLMLEAMAQATGLLALHSLRAPDRPMFYFVGIDKARFRRPVGPGDRLVIEVRMLRMTRGVCKVVAEAKVEDAVAASAELMGALRELDETT
ncbi:MAG: 3-hydroxyacyl-ACP dehydratase FabZ [Gammaproteobacteria bacterium]|nr:3-hydroxyacyl-ACP dehydratase FabZ [Gammaproteobacteria bacterium]NIR84162.1 3-hydroxyacyl-ACP dehydratase FabZ [Gammaproteobacteria bacterium]NIR89474.1 3-hydroxyacyl-ACP dehydratase FabZ [Gammaproteobacteria bacterium]NIU05317.1 3-hydroxyacyl-ACP dehydratase FabZ [Gammaproteobacteria bacterium]NIV52257.1 3-hydroxyacyl-ACP dehydratase FabZ [Gammaproteobacteria bacterium]